MSKTDTYIAFGEWEDYIQDLTQTEKGDVLDALFAYWRRGEKPTFPDRAVATAWRPIQHSIDRCNSAYESKCEKNRENGKKGGRPRKSETEKANGFLGFSEKSEKTLPKPEPKPKPNIYKKQKNRFMNFDERTYTDEEYTAMEGGE